MDPEIKSLLEENIRISRETNELLKTMNRQAWWGFAGRVVLWVLIVILPLLLLPMIISQFMTAITGESGGEGYDIEGLQKLYEQYKVE